MANLPLMANSASRARTLLVRPGLCFSSDNSGESYAAFTADSYGACFCDAFAWENIVIWASAIFQLWRQGYIKCIMVLFKLDPETFEEILLA